jgi:hypothetical protein
MSRSQGGTPSAFGEDMSNNQLKTIDPKALENTTGGADGSRGGNGGVLDGINGLPGGTAGGGLPGGPFGPKKPRPCMACGMG